MAADEQGVQRDNNALKGCNQYCFLFYLTRVPL